MNEEKLEEPMQIALLADELRIVALAHSLSLPAIFHPQGPLISWTLRNLMGVKDSDDYPVTVTGRDGKPSLQFSAREVLEAVRDLESSDLQRDMMSAAMLTGGMRIGDVVTGSRFYTTDAPIIQFARHFRNACAHGDRWHFKGKEPRWEASTRSITLTRDLHGTKATWTLVDHYNYFEFLDEIRAYFTGLAMTEAAEATFDSVGGREISVVHGVVVEQFRLRAIPMVYEAQMMKIALEASRGNLYRPTLRPSWYHDQVLPNPGAK